MELDTAGIQERFYISSNCFLSLKLVYINNCFLILIYLIKKMFIIPSVLL
jgi:hypothetical protein